MRSWARQLNRREQIRSREQMQGELARSICGRIGLPADNCEESARGDQP
jgi:hypothetical protein